MAISYTGLHALQAIPDDDGCTTAYTLWAAQRQFASGAAKVKLRDVTITTHVPSGGGPGSDPSYDAEMRFDYVLYKIGIYKRGVAAGPVASVTIRRNWGQSLGYVTIGNTGGGFYSFQTQLVGAYRNGSMLNPYRGYVRSLFDVTTG